MIRLKMYKVLKKDLASWSLASQSPIRILTGYLLNLTVTTFDRSAVMRMWKGKGVSGLCTIKFN